MPSAKVVRNEIRASRPVEIRLTFKLPARLWVVIIMFAVCLLALTIPVALSRSKALPSDLFADYIDFFPGAYWSMGLERTFRCNVDVATGVKYCFLRPPGTLFTNIGLTIVDNQITRTTFSLYENTLKAGDLATLWGKPEVQISGYIAYLDWRDQKISAVARTDDGRFDYSLLVSSVTFY